MFINLCKYQQLNPFLREAYLIKYGSQPAQLVVGKAAFEARAERDGRYEGYDAGIVVQKEDKTLEDIFSRQGFTDNYFTGRITEKMTGVRTDSQKSRTSEIFTDSPLTDTKIKKAAATISPPYS